MGSEHVLNGPELSTQLSPFRENTSVLDILCECMKNNPNDISQIEAQTGNSISMIELFTASSSIASNLKEHGVTRGDIIALCSETCINAYCMLLGVMFTGATAAILSSKLKQDDFLRLLAGTKAKMIYCSEDCVENVSKAPAEGCKVIVANAKQYDSSYIDYYSLLEYQNSSFKPFEVTDLTTHTPLLLFSSGTTGLPKGILITNIGLQRIAYIFCRNNMKTFISISSFAWISSTATMLSGLIKKHSIVWCDHDLVRLLENTEKFKADAWMLTPASMNALIKEPSLNKYDISSVKYIFIGGAVVTKSLRETFIKTVCQNRIGIMNLYGATEIGVITAWDEDVDLINSDKANSVGTLSSGSQMKFINKNGEAVGPNTDGDVLVKSIGAMAGYWDALSIQGGITSDNEGWYHTGDVGHYDSDGYIYVTGRKKDIFLINNQKVSVAEVEGLVTSHPEVYEATIIAKPHPVDMNHLVAFVVRKNKSTVTENEIIKFVEDQVEDAKRLRGGVIFLDTIPKTTAGKIHQRLLYEKLNNLLN